VTGTLPKGNVDFVEMARENGGCVILGSWLFVYFAAFYRTQFQDIGASESARIERFGEAATAQSTL
jgi:hypothetical protein